MRDEIIQHMPYERDLLYRENHWYAGFKQSFAPIILLAVVAIALAFPVSCQSLPVQTSQGPTIPPPYMQGPPSIPADFSGDWYSVEGGPNLQITLARSSIYRNQNTSLYLTVTNNGRVTSFKVVTQPNPTRQDEVFAAQQELQLEALRSTAQDISVKLVAVNKSAMDLKREVAYAGSLREGQVSQPLVYPIEVYENTVPGDYTLYAVANYTYQQDVAVKPHSDSPQNPDIYYLYNTASQTIPITLNVQKLSLIDLKALSASPGALDIGSKNNVVKVIIQNQGTDVAKDIVARLRPETGVYVDMDESPIPILRPGEKAELVYKVDISKDAIAGKSYRFTLLFDYSDPYRKNLVDSDYVYLTVQPSLSGIILQYWWAVVIVLAIVALAAISIIRRRRSASGQ
ncbi:MAG: COG1361 S-layer family protein [Methanotrichaceae archaeon]